MSFVLTAVITVSFDLIVTVLIGVVFAGVYAIRNLSQLELVDATGARVLSEIVTTLERRGVTVLLKGVQTGHEELFRTVGVLKALRHDNPLFTDLSTAIAHARSHVKRGDYL